MKLLNTLFGNATYRLLTIGHIVFLLILAGCTRTKIHLPSSEIIEIRIENKFHARDFDSKEKEITITDTTEIKRIINSLNQSTPTKERAHAKSNYGFFDVYMFDKKNERLHYEILYTVYDGVIIVDLNWSGSKFQNDSFEKLITSYFHYDF